MGRRLKGGAVGNGNNSEGRPLRKVIDICFVGGVRMEAYECGHICMPKSDIIGETNAARRRCFRCKMGKPVHFTGTPPRYMTSAEYDARSKTGAYKPMTDADWERVRDIWRRTLTGKGPAVTRDELDFMHGAKRENEFRYATIREEVNRTT